MAPLRNGSRLKYTTTMEVKVQLVGGRIESYIGGQAAEERSANFSASPASGLLRTVDPQGFSFHL
jgi:hypothetical protein